MTATRSHALVDTASAAWIPLGQGISFKPIAFGPGGRRQLLLRLEPGTVIPLHRHQGDVHAFTLEGHRTLGPDGPTIGPGSYLHEPVGNIDTWWATNDGPCVVHIAISGRLEDLDTNGAVTSYDDTDSLHRTYLDWCDTCGLTPDPNLIQQN
jgi:2,4'-dihydroxyacetophenone dioxygenase